QRSAGGQIVGRLSRAVDDEIRALALDQVDDRVAVPDVQLVMREATGLVLEVPGGVAVRTEEGLAHVVVDAVNGPVEAVEERDGLGADEPTAPGHEGALHGPRREPTPPFVPRARPPARREERAARRRVPA